MPLTMGKKLGENRGMNNWILSPNEFDLTFGISDYGAKFQQTKLRIASVGEATLDRQTDMNGFINVPCYAIELGHVKSLTNILLV